MKKAHSDENLERLPEAEQGLAELLNQFGTVYGRTLDAELASGSDDDKSGLEKLRKEALRQILQVLSEYDMYLLELHKVDDLSANTIAELTGEDVHWLRYQLKKIEARVRDRARRCLKASGKKSSSS